MARAKGKTKDHRGTQRFYKKGSNAHRVVGEGAGRWNGSGKADRLYVVKGTAYELKGFPGRWWLYRVLL